MQMNSLTTTKMFTLMDKIWGITKVIADPKFDIGKYVVDQDKYEYLTTYFKGYKYPLTKNVIESLISGTTRPLILSEPKDQKDKAIMFSPAIPGFLAKYDGALTSFVDISPRAKYVRTKTSNEIEFLKISERDFYTFMQVGYLNRLCNVKGTSLEYNIKFCKLIAEIYSFLLFKCISSTYPVSSSKSGSEILIFICAVFAFQNFFNFPLDKAIEYALTLKGVNKTTVMNNCRFYIHQNEELDMRYETTSKHTGVDIKGKQVKIYPIDVFIGILSEEFSFIKSGKMDFRLLLGRYTSMYGANSVLAIEHFFSFFAMMEMATMKINFYNDMMIDNAAGVYIDEINKIIANI
jgi:hypothetical protein